MIKRKNYFYTTVQHSDEKIFPQSKGWRNCLYVSADWRDDET